MCNLTILGIKQRGSISHPFLCYIFIIRLCLSIKFHISFQAKVPVVPSFIKTFFWSSSVNSSTMQRNANMLKNLKKCVFADSISFFAEMQSPACPLNELLPFGETSQYAIYRCLQSSIWALKNSASEYCVYSRV